MDTEINNVAKAPDPLVLWIPGYLILLVEAILILRSAIPGNPPRAYE